MKRHFNRLNLSSVIINVPFLQVIPLTGSGDGASATNPCLEMRCGADSYCVARADGGGAECICSPGFEKEEVRLLVELSQFLT